MNAPRPALLTSSQMLRQQAYSAYADGQIAAAHELLTQAVRAEPLDADALADLAAAELNSGQFDSALGHARRALILEPLHDSGRYAMACAYHGQGAAQHAVTLMQRITSDAKLRLRNPELALAAAQVLAQWTGRPAESAQELQIADPATLDLRSRFDILVKYLYALARLNLLPPWVNVDTATLYRRHIHLRTGGVEPGEEQRKRSVDDFVVQFDALIASMASSGFDPAHPIPLSRDNDLPRGGAHRLATALAVRCDVAINPVAGPGWSWDDEWFRTHGFALEERNVLLRAWAQLKREHAAAVVLWSPVEAAWDEIEAAIERELPIVSRRTIELPRAGFNELVYDIYAFDCGARAAANITRKVELLAMQAARVRVLFVERPADAPFELVRGLKTRLRANFRALAPVDHFTTVHISESVAETQHLLAIFASANNLRWLAQRRSPSPQLLARLEALRAQASRYGFAQEACCVVGGSVLDALGLRSAEDLDFTLRTADRLKHFDDGVTAVESGLDVVSRGYARSPDGSATPDDDRLVDDPGCHFLVRGVRFADPRIVLARKQQQRRDKDLRDVALLGDWFERIGLAWTTPRN